MRPLTDALEGEIVRVGHLAACRLLRLIDLIGNAEALGVSDRFFLVRNGGFASNNDAYDAMVADPNSMGGNDYIVEAQNSVPITGPE